MTVRWDNREKNQTVKQELSSAFSSLVLLLTWTNLTEKREITRKSSSVGTSTRSTFVISASESSSTGKTVSKDFASGSSRKWSETKQSKCRRQGNKWILNVTGGSKSESQYQIETKWFMRSNEIARLIRRQRWQRFSIRDSNVLFDVLWLLQFEFGRSVDH